MIFSSGTSALCPAEYCRTETTAPPSCRTGAFPPLRGPAPG
ncbi:hypothetical protein ACFQY7_10035 [Actinomadura luteofluorescens]